MLPWSLPKGRETCCSQHNMGDEFHHAVLSVITGGGMGQIGSRPIPTSTSYSRPRRSFGAALRARSRLVCSASSRHGHVRGPFGLSIWFVQLLGEFAGLFRQTRTAFLQHENAKAELKG
jgi:hypothetical protein